MSQNPDKFHSFNLVLPWGPSANEIWRSFSGSPRPYLSPKYRKFIKEVNRAYNAQGSPKIGEKNLVAVRIKLFPPHNRSFDIDNRVKPILDALTKCGLWVDDRYVRALTVESWFSIEDGAVVVEVEPFEPDPVQEATVASWYKFKRLERKSKRSKSS